MTHHEVVIAGGGPTGLMLAGELALAGIDAVVIERRQDQELVGSRAGGLHARTIEMLDLRGIADRFLSQGQVAQVAGFGGIRLDISDFPTRHPYGLGLWQNHIERTLAEWVRELGVPILYNTEAIGFTQDADGVTVVLSTGQSLRADYLAGCDGGRSLVRKLAGIAFEGWDATTCSLIAEVEMTEEPELGTHLHRSRHGTYAFGRAGYTIRDGKVVFDTEGPVRVLITDDRITVSDHPTLQDLRNALVTVCGRDYGAHHPTWISRFTDMARQAVTYRKARVLLAGDAAHVHSPVGGQGLNTGVQDAMNLGWKLAQVIRNVSPESLLDTYHAERHPVGARILQNAMAQTALLRTDDHTGALRESMSRLLAMDEPRRHFGAMMSGLDIHYDFDCGDPGSRHPLVGRRMPDIDLATAEGPTRFSSLLHRARPVLLCLDARMSFEITPWANRVSRVDARYDGPWALPAIGNVPSLRAVLVRPDGYVAWAGDSTDAGLDDALTMWFGGPAT